MGFIAIQDNCTLCAFVCIQTHSFAQKKDITVQKRLYFDIKKFVSRLKAEGTKHRVDCYAANTKTLDYLKHNKYKPWVLLQYKATSPCVRLFAYKLTVLHKKHITVQKRLYFDIKKFVSGLKAEGTKHRVDCYTANTKHQFT